MREKIEFDKHNPNLLELLGISPERAEQLESCEFHGGGNKHTQTEHLMAAYHNEEITLKELLFVYYTVGFQNGSFKTADKAADFITRMMGSNQNQAKEESPTTIH
jgi:hypothetical protein